MSKIILEDFNEGDGYYKINLAYLSKEQVEEIESLVSKWNPTDEDIKSCIRMCLTDANEQRFKDYGTNLKDCIAWLEKQEVQKEDVYSKEFWEDVRKGLFNFLEELSERGINTNFDRWTKSDCINWLLWVEKQGEKFQYWKPSEEQLDALDYAYNSCPDTERGNYYESVLETLIDDLYKLSEKQCDKKSIDDLTQQEAMDIAVAKCFEQGEQKPVDKVEPKFKVGDWIINKSFGNVKQIKEFDDNESVWFTDGTGTFVEFLKGYRPWTIKDAKNGDVLEFGDHGRLVTGILSFVNKTTGKVDVSCLLEGDKFKVGIFYNLDTVKPHPATKEQRNILFQKMKEAGYEWNAQKKELKKIEKQSEHKQEINNFDVIPGLYKCVHRMFDDTPEGKLLFEVGKIYKCLSKHDRAEFEVSYGHSVYLEDPVVCKHFIPFGKEGKPKWSDDELLMIITWFSRIKQMATDMTTYNNHVMNPKECLREISVLAKESIEYLNSKFEKQTKPKWSEEDEMKRNFCAFIL